MPNLKINLVSELYMHLISFGKSLSFRLLQKAKNFFWIKPRPFNNIISRAMLTCLLLALSVAAPAPAWAADPEPNPKLNQACGLDIALVIDSSGSIDLTELSEMKNAFNGFVAELLPGTPSMFSVTDFDNTAAVLQPFTFDVNLIGNAISIPGSGGSTNWQDGLSKTFSTFDPRTGPDHPNLIVFASDGEPNKYGNNYGSGADFSQYAFEQAVLQANEIKNSGIRIITLGIGLTIEGADHLKAISSADAYYDVADFAALSNSLKILAADLCGGTVTVTKFIDADGNMQTEDDRPPGPGWGFEVAGNSDITGQDGKSIAWKVDPGTHAVKETESQGYFLADAYCTGATGNGAASGTEISGIEIRDSDIVSCIFINSPNPAEASHKLSVFKDGTGSGSVADDVGSIACGDACSDSYDPGASVVLTATPGSDSVFAGWSGAGCSGAGACDITMDSDKSVTATFNLSQSGGGGGETGVADPAVIKTLDNAAPAPGAQIVYTINVYNAGISTATAVTITDPLPASVIFSSSDGVGAVYDATTTTVIWNINELGPGEEVFLQITATVKNDKAGDFVNTATLSTTGGNSRTDNDSSSITAAINRPSQNSGGGSVYTAGNSSGGSGIPVPLPLPQVAGASTSVPALGLLMPEVLGEVAELPRTGLPLWPTLFGTVILAAVLDRKFRCL